jgi:hypothetical protein
VKRTALAPALCVFASVAMLFALYKVDDGVASFHDKTTRASDSSGNLNHATIKIDGSTLDVEFAPGQLDVLVTKLTSWISTAAHAVDSYYGRFPVHEAQILIVPVQGRAGVLSGTSWGSRPAFTRVYLGQRTAEGDLKDDWVMTHEMVHYAFPSVAREHHWIEEGIATYVEPIARLETGEIDATKVWGDLVAGLPYGMPGRGDEGLDHTHTWGRTYWGGAMFCLLADVQIRRATHDRYGLRDALRAIVKAGGNMQTTWPLTRAFDIGDKAVGVPVLAQLFGEMKATPIRPNLVQLWSNLGVEIDGKTIRFNDGAPWAAVRRAIAADTSGA